MCFGGGGGGSSGRAALQARGAASQRRVQSREVDKLEFTPYTYTPGNKTTASPTPVVGQRNSYQPLPGRGGGPGGAGTAEPIHVATEEQHLQLFPGRTSDRRAYKKVKGMEVVAISGDQPTNESALRIKTRKARSEVANANDASRVSSKRASKRRGGLRIDNSSSVYGGGSGVTIPK